LICHSNAGDVNGDGLDDLIVGADKASLTGKSKAGKSYVVFGNGQWRIWNYRPVLLSLWHWCRFCRR
jgi:hypothetical protein